MDWVYLAQDTDNGLCDNDNESSGFVKCANFLTSCGCTNFSRRALCYLSGVC